MRNASSMVLTWLLVLSLAACSGGEEEGGNAKPSANNDSAITRLNLARTISVLSNDSDPDGDVLSIASVSQGTLGSVAISGVNVVYTPNTGASGTDSFSYSVTDGNGGSASGQVSVTITTAASNTAPLAVPDIVSTAIGLTSTHDVLANDTDADGDPLTLSILTPPSNGTASVLPDRRIQYVHTGATTSVDVLEYEIDDGQGGTARAFVALVVNQTLILPGSNDPQAINDTGKLNPGTFIDINVLSNDFNPGGLTLSVASFSQPSLGQGSVTDQGGGVLRYTAIGGAQGSDFFFYTITLPNSTVLAAYVFITINDAPVAVDDFYEVDPGQIVNLPVLLNDSDANGDLLSITANTTPATGILLAPVNGVFNYVAASSPHTIATFTYTIEDPLGRSDTATVTIGVSNPPVANNDSASGGATIDVNVLTNDTDPDMDALSVKSFTQGANGSVSNQGGGVLRYTPNTGFEGLDSFTYVCQDVFLRTASATVSVVVNDFTPPAPISDLTMVYSSTIDTVTLSWTATGDSGFAGRATSYVIKTATFAFSSAAFDSVTTVSQSKVPATSGSAESITIPLTWFTGTHYFAIKALDEIPNASAMSNLASVNTNATASFPATPYDFGNVGVLGSATHDFLITNNSTHVDLILSSITIAGAGSYSILTGGISGPSQRLTPGATHTVRVQLAPTVPGTQNATLMIAHNAAPTASPYNISLSGFGLNVAPTYRVQTIVMAAGSAANFVIDVSDQNSQLPGTDDLVSVVADLSAFGGSSSQPLTSPTIVSLKTKRFALSVPTSGMPANLYLIPLTAVDTVGNEARVCAMLVIRTGALVQVGPGTPNPTLEDGILATANGDVLLVKEGSYVGIGNQMLVLGGRQIIIVGEYNPPYVSFSTAQSPRIFNLQNSGEIRAMTIAGLAFTGNGTGIWCEGNPSPTIANCLFLSNGIHVQGSSSPAILNCNFDKLAVSGSGNSVVGLYTNSATQIPIRSCDFRESNILGTGANFLVDDCSFAAASTPIDITGGMSCVCVVQDSRFKDGGNCAFVPGGTLSLDVTRCACTNSGGFGIISNGSMATVQISDCIIQGGGGAALTIGGSVSSGMSAQVKNCLITGSQNPNGGSLITLNCDNPAAVITLENLTIANNASQDAAIELGSAGTVDLKDCVIAGNTRTPAAAQIRVWRCTAQFQNCCLDTTTGGIDIVSGTSNFAGGTNGNSVADPLFVNGAGGNFRLQHLAAGQAADSPCIDAGSQTAAAAGLGGKTTRTDNVLDSGVLDMGYHYDP